MKRMLAAALALALLTSLCACAQGSGDGSTQPQQIVLATDAPTEAVKTEEETEAAVETTAPAKPETGYAMVWEGVTLTPGDAFDPAALPEADSVYTVPSCAIEGTDKVYSYGVMEVTAFDDGAGERIYSVYFLDPNLTTPEGLAQGDEESRVEELYGADYAQEGTARVYTQGQTQLVVILQDGIVISIEYRLVVGNG